MGPLGLPPQTAPAVCLLNYHSVMSMHKPLPLVASFLVIAFSIVVSVATMAIVDAQTLTPAQLDQLGKLSQAQRDSILKALTQPGSALVAPAVPNQTAPSVSTDSIDVLTAEPEQENYRFTANDSLIIELIEEGDGIEMFDSIRDSLGKKLYQLDSRGGVYVPGVGRILLAGLTEQEAQLRLQAESALNGLSINVYLLPVEAVDESALEPFGYELFTESDSFEIPQQNIPIPTGYTVGPGDVLSLFVFGQQSADYRLQVGRDGQIIIPEVGPLAVAGMNFEQVREEINKRMEQNYIGVKTSLTLSELRSIQVFVLGDVKTPGSYTLSSLSTMTNALIASGGIARSGSLRAVQLKRNNRVVTELDLYELLLRGNSKNDRRIRSGDVVYVPPVGAQVSVFGQVNRPAIYEIKYENELSDILSLAGGLLPSAYQQEIQIERYSRGGSKTQLVADFTQAMRFEIRPGDQVNVLGALDEVRDGILLKGHVKREGIAQWRSGLRLLDVLPRSSMFRLQADQEYLLIRRVDESTGRVSLVSANWRVANRNKFSSDNIELMSGDTVHVFSLSGDRALKIAPLIEEMEAQGSYSHPTETVSVQGRVRSSGKYPYQPNMRISDLLKAAGSTLDNAYLEQVEITRVERDGGARATVHLQTSLHGLAEGSDEDLVLMPDDVLTIKEIPLWREQQKVEVLGEIMFPGTYSASRGERISEVIERAGGLTSMAFVSGSIFVRKNLREREREQIEKLVDRVRLEVQGLSSTEAEARAKAEQLLTQLEETEAVGRLVIDLDRALAGDLEHDVILEDGDKLVVPSKSQEVTVIGEVQYPTSHIYQKNHNQFLYIEKSGGLTSRADRRRIYVIRADGQVIAHSPNRWFSSASGVIQTEPGDTIVVPFDADRIGKLELWSTVSQIVYNIGVAAAAVAAF